MRIDQLPELPQDALSANVPCTYNGADYQTPLTVNQSGQYYQSGERINRAFQGFGYISSSRKQMTITVILPKPMLPSASVSITSVTASIRTVGGGYVGTALNTDFTSIFSSADCNGTVLTMIFINTSEFRYGQGGTSYGVVTNNTPVCGQITLNAVVN